MNRIAFNLVACVVCVVVVLGGIKLFEYARVAAGACGPHPPKWKVTERMTIVHQVFADSINA
jgi:hypothetical protein